MKNQVTKQEKRKYYTFVANTGSDPKGWFDELIPPTKTVRWFLCFGQDEVGAFLINAEKDEGGAVYEGMQIPEYLKRRLRVIPYELGDGKTRWYVRASKKWMIKDVVESDMDMVWVSEDGDFAKGVVEVEEGIPEMERKRQIMTFALGWLSLKENAI